jgi:WD40 repeat protein
LASTGPTQTELIIYNVRKQTTTPFIVQGSLSSFALSYDGKWVATTSDDNTARLWSSNGKEQLNIDSLSTPEWISFDTASKNMMIFNGRLYRYSLADHYGDYADNELFERTPDKGGFTASAFTLGQTGRYGASFSDDRLAIHDIFNGQISSNRWSITVNRRNSIQQLFFSNDDQIFAAWCKDNVIRIWDTRSGVEKARFAYDGQVFRTEAFTYNPIKSVSLSPDGNYLAVALQNRDSLSQTDNPLYILETKGYISSLFFEDEDESRGISFGSQEGNTLMASGGGDGHALVRIGNPETGEIVIICTEKPTRVWTTCFNPHSEYLAFADNDGTLWVWDWIGKVWLFKDDDAGEIGVLCFSSDGKYLATAGRDNHATVYLMATKKALFTLEHHDSINKSVNDIVFAPGGKLIATASGDNTVCLWSLPDGKKVTTLIHNASVEDISFDPSGKFIAAVSSNDTVTLWQTNTGKKLFSFPHEKLVNKTAFSPDGKYLAAASGDCCGLKGGDMTDGKVTIWNISTGDKVMEILHPFTVWSICYSSDGKHIASSSSDGNIRIWDVGTGNEMSRIRLRFSTPFPIEIQFSPDGKYIGAPGEAFLWRPEDLIKEADARKSRELSATEKKQYFRK